MIKHHDHGDHVAELHRRLAEIGYAPPKEECDAKQFGDGTLAAVRALQAGRRGADRQPLKVDGMVGSKTDWALANPGGDSEIIARGWRCDLDGAPEALQPAIAAAVAEIGNHAQPAGSSRGRLIDKYGQRGTPWAAHFLSWCFASIAGGCPWSLVESVPHLHDWGEHAGRFVDVALAAPGDVFVAQQGTAWRAGIVVGVSFDRSRLFAVEGDSASAVRGTSIFVADVKAVIRPLLAT